MPTRIGVSADCQADVLTADEFLESPEPGRYVDLIDSAADSEVEVRRDRTPDRDRGTKFIEYGEQQVRERRMTDLRTSIHGFFRHNRQLLAETAPSGASIRP